MDELFEDDPLDITGPDGVVLLAGTGVLDGDAHCGCWCACERALDWAGDVCDACRAGEHRECSDLDDLR